MNTLLHLVAQFALPMLIVSIIVWPTGLIHCLSVRDGSACRNGSRGQWLILIVLMGALGAGLYLLFGRPLKSATA